ncbi:MAG: DNA repair protein RecO [Alphaproteobacteria bacterium]|nr:DNA repair protein RecO [Alphaproteobacteria bacterium]
MDWTDHAIILAARKHGENNAIVHLLTRTRGRHAGLVRGGSGRRLRGVLQPGNEVAATWRARLEEHLGHLTVELEHARAAPLLEDPLRLAALTSACALCEVALPEREPHLAAYDGFDALLVALDDDQPDWPQHYVHWELTLLADLGFGLDFSACAATGSTTDLVYVSPKSGRAVSASAGAPYRDRLLPLPAFLLRQPAGVPFDRLEIRRGLQLTGFFLAEHVLRPQNIAVPAARYRLVDRFGAETH